MSDCIFCSIVAQQASAYQLYEDDSTLVFLDIFPVARGHTLVIPKEHAETIFEMAPEQMKACAATTHRVAGVIRQSLSPDGVAVIQLNGAAAGQTVFHYHTHLIPRKKGDSMVIHSRVPGDPNELADVAEILRAALS